MRSKKEKKKKKSEFLTVPRQVAKVSHPPPYTHTHTHTRSDTFQRAESVFVNEPSCFSRGLKLLTLRGGSVTAGSHRRTENTEKSFFPMDFLTGLRPLLFTYVLINGILITLQTKEGERLHFYLNFSLHLTRCVGEGAARDPHC